jgi:hypothetical protein
MNNLPIAQDIVSIRLAKNDLALLSAIGEYQVVTTRQLTAVSCRSCQVIRRRIRAFEDQGLIVKKSFGYGRNQGRPEEIILLSQQGLKLLSTNAFAPPPTGAEDIKSHTLDHELLLNWFRIHLMQMERSIPCLSVKYLASRINSPTGKVTFRMHLPIELKDDRLKAIIPDGTFAVLHREIGRALLFFLEVDRGSEILVSSKRKTNSIRHKILCYQELYRNGHYKSLEEFFGSTFKGFRLLFLTNSEARVAAMCRFAQSFQNPDFIWLTDQSRMFDLGLSANIWVRVGKYEDPRESILGPRFASESPITCVR